MKLSSRSPKDSSMESRYMRKIVKAELTKMMEEGLVKKGEAISGLKQRFAHVFQADGASVRSDGRLRHLPRRV